MMMLDVKEKFCELDKSIYVILRVEIFYEWLDCYVSDLNCVINNVGFK